MSEQSFVPVLDWDFKLGCDTAPTLPISNILTQMKELNCSIVFKPHVSLHVHYCPFSSYTITIVIFKSNHSLFYLSPSTLATWGTINNNGYNI